MILALWEKILFWYHYVMQYEHCPFGSTYQNYWNHRYEFFSYWDQGIKTDREGLYSVIPEKHARELAQHIQPKSRVLDAFGGIGGSSIGFARLGHTVTVTELLPERCAMISHNIRVTEQIYPGIAQRITVVSKNCFTYFQPNQFDVIFLDPPWGGVKVMDDQTFNLTRIQVVDEKNNSVNGLALITRALAVAPCIILRLPVYNKDAIFEELQTLYRKGYHLTSHTQFLAGKPLAQIYTICHS